MGVFQPLKWREGVRVLLNRCYIERRHTRCFSILCKEGGDILDSPVFASTVPVHSTLAANQSYGRPVEPRDEQHAVPIGECASVSSLESTGD